MSSSRTPGQWYPDSTKHDALKLWLVTGNLRQVSMSMDIPYETLKTWRYSKWWNELASEIRTEGHLALSAKMQKLADKAMEVTLDRLENGEDVVIQKTGEIIKRPVSMRDAHQVAVSFQDRALRLQNSPQDEAAQLAVHDRLAQLADAFSKMAGKTRKVEVLDIVENRPVEAGSASPQREVLDVSFTQHAEVQPEEARDLSEEAIDQTAEEVLDAVHDQREAGLSEGEELGTHQEAFSPEGPRTANPSS